MVQFCASVVTSDDPIFSSREIDNPLGLTTMGGETLTVLADVPEASPTASCFVSVRRTAVPRPLMVGPSRYGHMRRRSFGAGRSAPEVPCTQ
jgi:hypothetical protein